MSDLSASITRIMAYLQCSALLDNLLWGRLVSRAYMGHSSDIVHSIRFVLASHIQTEFNIACAFS